MSKKTVHVVYKVTDTELLKADKSVKNLGKDTQDAQNKMNNLGKQTDSTGKQMVNAFTSVKGIIATLGIVALGKQIIDITANFEKFEAVLTNTLGSRSMAKQAMKDILEFATKTPFAVEELTSSYVKLANQGFKPTLDQMRRLGDLAASTGKSFDQLTEAIIDAQTGEFERLKEFGIRASKEGDKVTFTFKGVKQQVDFTNDSIRAYILSLGDLKGVSGAMDSISKTLGGTISNLGDAFGQLANNLGKISRGPVAGSLKAVIDLLNTLNKTLELANMTAEDFALIGLKKFNEGLDEEMARLKETGKVGKEFNQFYFDIVMAINATNVELQDLGAEMDEHQRKLDATGRRDQDAVDKTLLKIDIAKAELQGLMDIRTKLDEEIKKYVDLTKQKVIPTEDELFAIYVKQRQELEAKARLQREANAKMAGNAAGSSFGGAERMARLHNLDLNDGVRDLELKHEKDFQKELTEAQEQGARDRFNQAELERQRRIHLLMAVADTTAQILSSLFAYREKDNSEQEAYYEKQLEMAGDNEAARKRIQQRQEQDAIKQRSKEAEERKNAALKQIAVDTAINIVRSVMNNGGIPYGLPFGALALALGLAQAATVRKYAKGEVDIQGPGTGTSDSINARLSKGETVTTAKRTSESKGLLTLIRDGKINDKVMNTIGGKKDVIHAKMDSKAIVKAIEDNSHDYLRIADDMYEVKKAKEGSKTLIRKKYLSK